MERLTRSLAAWFELFDAHGVSFISMTQAFNTTTNAVYPSSRHVSPLGKEFVELAAERLAATGTGEDDKAVAVFNQSFG